MFYVVFFANSCVCGAPGQNVKVEKMRVFIKLKLS